ncbi:hypothetical protein DFH09DRAFT_1438094 [Mycena vulgaris]|nr:hypothetical protein DFH09DRAFT_1438094 [Mycena vulgaris]
MNYPVFSTPPLLPISPPEVASLLANNDAPDPRNIPLIIKATSKSKYLCSLRLHLVEWKNSRIGSLPSASARLLHEYDILKSIRNSQNGPGLSPALLRDPIHDLPPAITQIILDRDALEECARLHEGLLFPIRHLPPELIANIFERVPHPIRYSYSRSAEREHTPWYLAHIFSRWRACALADPNLWAKIFISGEHLYPSRFEKVFSTVKTLLLLSKDTHLDVSFDSSRLPNGQAQAHFLVLLNAVTDHCTRWERLSLEDAGIGMLFYPDLSKVRFQVPSLRRLDVYFLPAAENLDWVEGAPNLQELRRLHVEECNFLDYLVAPVIQDLFVHRDIDAILPFLERSHTQLTSLAIFEWGFGDDIVPLLRASPSLKHLCLDVVHWGDSGRSISGMLGELARTPDLCSNLTSFIWRDGSTGTEPFLRYQDIFLEMIESRCSAHSLTSLRLFLWDPRLTENAAERLRSLEYQGLDFGVLGLSTF